MSTSYNWHDHAQRRKVSHGGSAAARPSNAGQYVKKEGSGATDDGGGIAARQAWSLKRRNKKITLAPVSIIDKAGE